MTDDMIQTGLKVTINDLTQQLVEALTAKNILAVQLTQLTENVDNYQAVLDSDPALLELFKEAQAKLQEAIHGN
ncbi:hypothetical protein [Streptococcus cristatus]|uniref:hypothetical protein n=1 Tax=Streptococcus cristatus TaxID=45634 RepID=UPI001EF37707|nr:hypothetical protein [Streptococcus cristatus]MCG7329905.1 hypothetical protein [Streptococcus cristatus]